MGRASQRTLNRFLFTKRPIVKESQIYDEEVDWMPAGLEVPFCMLRAYGSVVNR